MYVAQLEKYLPSLHNKAMNPVGAHTYILGVVMHACGLSTEELEAEDQKEVQGNLWLYSEFQTLIMGN